jgi:hypothetical protein
MKKFSSWFEGDEFMDAETVGELLNHFIKNRGL